MQFFSSLWKSIYSVSWYKEHGTSYTFGRALWRYMRLSRLLLSIVLLGSIALLAIFLTPEKARSVLDKGRDALKQVYPADLVMTLTSTSGLQTNATGPVVFPLSLDASTPDGHHGQTPYEHWLVIDTQATPLMITDHKTMSLLTKDAIVFQKHNTYETTVIPFRDILKNVDTPLVITSGYVEQFTALWRDAIITHTAAIERATYMGMGIGGMVVGMIISFFIGLWIALMLFLYALGLRLLSKAMRLPYTYQEAYSFAAAGFVLPFLFLFSSWIFKGVLLAVIVGRVWYLLSDRRNKSAQQSAQEEPSSTSHASQTLPDENASQESDEA